jgi:hypothetical protein
MDVDRTRRAGRRAVLGALGVLLVAAPLLGDDEGDKLAAILRDAAPSIVTVKVVTTTTFQMGSESTDRESRLALPGVVVDASGLVMTSNMPFAPERLIKLYGMGEGRDKGPKFKTVAGEIEVIFEGDEKENPAFLAATDSNLGIAFLQIEGLGGRKIKAVDFTRGANPAIGERVAAVSRLPKGYDSAAYFETARVSGEMSKPRRGWMVDHGLSPLGLPVFASAGKVVGILAVADDSFAESEADATFAIAMRMLTGGGGVTRPFIVPAPTVAAVVDQARQQAAKMVADRAAKKSAPPPSR